MKYILLLLAVLPLSSFAGCKWSEREVFDEKYPSIDWRYCDEGNIVQQIEVSGVILKPTAKFIFNDTTCPECRDFYSIPSHNKDLTVISSRNSEADSNVWVVDIKNKKILYFSDEVYGRHIFFEWVSDTELIITHAGMGYGTEFYVKPVNGKWSVYKTAELEDI